MPGSKSSGDAAEIVHRGHLSILLASCESQVRAGNIPDWVDSYFREDDHLAKVTREAGLPPEAAIQLLTIAVFLDKALVMVFRRRTSAKGIARELNSLQNAHRKLFEGLSNISTDAYHWLCRVEKITDEDGQPLWDWKTPPIQEAVKLLKDLGQWLNGAEPVTWRPGPRKSPKFYAILLLGELLQEHKGEVLLDKLTELANGIVWPIAEHHGDDAELGDFVKEATEGIART